MGFIKILLYLFLLLFPVQLYAEIVEEECNSSEISGIFDLIVHSNSFINDPETFLVLDRVDDNLKFVPYVPEFKFRVFQNLNAKEGLKIANEILLNSAYVSTVKCTVLKDKSRSVLGYELKPIYFPWTFGVLEPVETRYKLNNDTIHIFIRLDPRVERQLNSGGDSFRED